MSNRLVYVLGLGLCSLLGLARAQAPEASCLSVSLEDKTGAASPIALSGSATLCEREEGSQLLYWYTGEWLGENRSEKSVMAAVLVVDLRYAHHVADEARFQIDNFFLSRALLGPGQKGTPFDFKGGSTKRVRPPTAALAAPSGSIRLAFAEFEDGTIFGDPAAALELGDIRSRKLAALRSIEAAYERDGERGVAEALQKRSGQWYLDTLLDGLRETQRTTGVVGTMNRVRGMLDLAASRRAKALSAR